jgi:hypothetical protein
MQPKFVHTRTTSSANPTVREAVHALRMHGRLVDGCKEAREFVRELAGAGMRYDRRDKLEKLLDGLLKEAGGKD